MQTKNTSYFFYPNTSFFTAQFFITGFIIFSEGFLNCSFSLAIMNLYACVREFLTWCRNEGSGSFKPKMSLTENKEVDKRQKFKLFLQAYVVLLWNCGQLFWQSIETEQSKGSVSKTERICIITCLLFSCKYSTAIDWCVREVCFNCPP